MAVGLAWVAPEAGSKDGWLHPTVTTKIGVALIFFFQGLVISLESLKRGALQWRIHLVIQLFTFVIFPIIGLILNSLLGQWIPSDLRLGFLFLCVLPSTISTSVVLTAVAGGNTPVALFNATLSNLLGIVFTPLSIGFLMKASGRTLPLGPIITEIALVLLLPMILGQVVRPLFKAWVSRNGKKLTSANSLIILYLVYTTFCESVKGGFWQQQSSDLMLRALFGVILTFVIVVALAYWIGRMMGFSREDQIASVFCSAKKTLASGVPLAKLIFGSSVNVGLILLPIMIYHPLQLMTFGVAAEKLKQQQPVKTK